MNPNNFPRLANYLAYQYPYGGGGPSTAAQAASFGRYSLVIATWLSLVTDSSAVAALKAQSARTLVIPYQASQEVWTTNGYNGVTGLDASWFVPLAPRSTLSLPLGSGDTSLVVVDAAFATLVNSNYATGPYLRIEGEILVVTAVNTGTNTLTVLRGSAILVGGLAMSTGTTLFIPVAHSAGAPVTLLDSPFNSQEILTDVSANCPTVGGLTWSSAVLAYVRGQLAAQAWDGLFWDNVQPDLTGLASGALDLTRDGTADAGQGTGQDWASGLAALMAASRTALPSGTLVGNGSTWFSGLSGMELETFPRAMFGASTSNWAIGLSVYLAYAGTGGLAPATIVNTDTSLTSTLIDLPTMRRGLATTCMGGGYYAYDRNPAAHGQTWWFDEYDSGVGSSVGTALADTTSTTLVLASGGGAYFQSGDTLFVCCDWATFGNSFADEQMTVTAVAGDSLSVIRAVNGSIAGTHAVGMKVMTAAQITAGQGWLGQPVGVARCLSLGGLGAELVANGDFESTTTSWTLTTAGGAVASVSQDTGRAYAGSGAAKISVTTATPATPANVKFSQTVGGLTPNAEHSLCFALWADGPRTVEVSVHFGGSVLAVEAPATVGWIYYQIPFLATVGGSGISSVTVDFNTARSTGSVWIDAVSCKTGSVGLWRRDFQHGAVLLNNGFAAQTVSLEAGYHHLTGSQDPTINDGAATTSETLQPGTARILRWTAPAIRVRSTRAYQVRTYSSRTASPHRAS